jgi:hypothetical protein
MELNITELEDRNTQFVIPENMFPALENKIISNDSANKKTVQFFNDAKPMIQIIPKTDAKMVRPHVPVPKQQLSYEDLLSKMGMVVENGKLHLINNRQTVQNTKTNRNIQGPNIHVQEPNISYIYNKYFKKESQQNFNQPRRPMSAIELRNMLINDILQKHRVKQMKSTKLIMPTANINVARTGNMNKLFSFSNR